MEEVILGSLIGVLIGVVIGFFAATTWAPKGDPDPTYTIPTPEPRAGGPKETGSKEETMAKKGTAEAAAVRIAAEMMVAAGMCLHDSPTKCRRVYVDEDVCERCIRGWLIRKGRKEAEG